MLRIRVVACAVLILTAHLAAGQKTPVPSEPYTMPVADFVGRYLDSATLGTSGARGYYAWKLRIAPERDRIYVLISYFEFVSYRLSTFVERVTYEPLKIAGPPHHGEAVLPFDQSLDITTNPAAWPLGVGPGHLRILDFDWDDRGRVYLALNRYWAILNENLELMVLSEPWLPTRNIFSFREAGRYYVLAETGESSSLYDVTEGITLLWTGGRFGQAVRAEDGTIAVINGSRLEIHTAETLIAGGASPLARFFPTPPAPPPVSSPTFTDVTTDGTNFYAIENRVSPGHPDLIHVVTRAGDRWTTKAYPAADSIDGGADRLAFGDGLLTVGNYRRFEIYRVVEGLLIPLDARSVNENWWNGANIPATAQPVTIGGRRFLITAHGGLGEVYLLAGPKRRSAHSP